MNISNPIEGRREKSDATRRRLVEATIEAIARHGLAKTTIATVAQIAELSPGLVGFHFRSKNQLVMEALGYLIERWRAGWARIAANPRLSAAERLRAIIDREFSSAWFNQRTVAIWYGFWGGVPTQAAYREMCLDAERTQTDVIVDNFRLLIEEGDYRDVDPVAAARGLSALLMGMYLTYGFDPEHFDRQQGKRICLSYLSGFFPKHFTQPWQPAPPPPLSTRQHASPAARAAGHAGPALGGWGVTAEYGALRDALMALPLSPVPAAAPQLSRAVFYGGSLASEESLRAEHRRLRDALACAEVQVHLLTPQPQLPYQPCVQDVGCMTPLGAIVAPPAEARRAGETGPLRSFYDAAGIPIWHTVTAGGFHGTNATFLRPGTVLVGCDPNLEGFAGATQLARRFEAEGWETRTALLPRPFHRIDSLLAVLSERHLLACRTLLAPEVADWIEQHGFDIVDHEHALDSDGGGFLALGAGKLLVANAAQPVVDRLRALGLQPIEVGLQSFSCLGIGLRQLVQPLRRDRVTQ
jgi:N-dimethylarginine dimethylaminohydrolase